MDRTPETGRKVPLLVLGELSAAPPGARTLEPGALSSISNINDYYVIVSVPEHALKLALDTLVAAGLSPDQLIVHGAGESALGHAGAASCGRLESTEGDSVEDVRSRLFAKVESQRQKKLITALNEAETQGLARSLGDAELIRVLDTVRIAHALACGYGLGPAAHARALRASLRAPAPPAVPWQSETALEELLPSVAAAVVDAFAKGVSCRDAIRERAGGLSFHARAELLHQVENCLSPLLGGRHVA